MATFDGCPPLRISGGVIYRQRVLTRDRRPSTVLWCGLVRNGVLPQLPPWLR
jgi:hypothetical protein